MKTTWIVYMLADDGTPLEIVGHPYELEAEAFQIMRNVSIKRPAERFRVVQRVESTVWEQPAGGVYPELVLGAPR